MTTIPSHLLNPPAGGWPVSEASILWAWLCYGLDPTAAETASAKKIRAKARREVSAIAETAPIGALPPRPRVVVRRSTWFRRDDEDTLPRPVLVVPAYPDWVSVSALLSLADQHGIRYESAPVVAPQKPVAKIKPGPKRAPDMQRAIERTNELIAEGWEPGNAAEEAADEFNVDPSSVARSARLARAQRNSQT